MEETSSSRRKFPAFPFEPYPIQVDFMSFLYDSLDRGGVAMLESPTGTGKTLSIICSALQWIVDRRKRPAAVGKFCDGDEEPDWMKNFVVVKAQERKEKHGRRFGPKPGNVEKGASILNLKDADKGAEGGSGGDDDMEFLLDEYESEEECWENSYGRLKRKVSQCLDSSDSDDVLEVEEDVSPKIYFTSRTHSQLSQFVKEFKKTSFASEINLVCLGSRKNLCINPEVLKLGNVNRINERCLELQRGHKNSRLKNHSRRAQGSKRSGGCPMLGKYSRRKLFKETLEELGALDIEDLFKLGSKTGSCPYYGTRDIVGAAHLVVLPYQSLLQKFSRESLGINLENNIVIIDEAHNLADSLTNMYNAKLTVMQLKQVLSHLEKYLEKFRSRLGSGNRRYIQTLVVLTKSFLRLLLGHDDSELISCMDENLSFEENMVDVSMTVNEFLFSLDIDNINFVKLVNYVKESHIIHKVGGYGLKLASYENCSKGINNHRIGFEESIVSSFQALADVLLSLIMNQAHAIVLAGGTLQPIEETRVRLFPALSTDQVHFFTCKHIIPPENILPIAVSCGPSGLNFDFSYNSRSSQEMMEELGRFIANLVAIVPEGMVVFFSSFEYEEQVYGTWKTCGILAKILKKKHLFREPRNNIDVEFVLREYKESITSHGAILLAVVGGRVSEGINFSDGMGRCVVMVGLPYPSLFDVELRERIKHIEGLGENSKPNLISNSSEAISCGSEILRSCKQRGKEYYENLCMKAVNQSIGRSIRHINDYAAVLLVDSRYTSRASNRNLPTTTDKLPLWIRERLVFANGSYGEVHKLLYQFYHLNKQKKACS
ncbi:hypothetical protein HPP92_023623 [Vanilla planifolia]|uniref:Helicase ATP-binding domain-containing protein n=1 Tax=Vanilla planifolia TaxID=51239 RepID=A0A835PIS2_VANPL|nr:hypothetical protein HPP92_023933 [Vanilla planifolia]KAG0455835.1 hypothetical protein HPP92_023623 [Vanilla planifolia]